MRVFKNILPILLILLFNVAIGQHTHTPRAEDCSDMIDISWVTTGGSIDVDEAMDVAVDPNGNIYVAGYFEEQIDFQGITAVSGGNRDFFVAKINPEGDVLWLETGGGVNDVYATGIAVDLAGNVYVSGTFEGDIEVQNNNANSSGATDIFLVKYNTNGNYLWGQYFGGFNIDLSGDVIVDNSGNPIITGTYHTSIYIDGNTIVSQGGNDYFVAKFSPTGNIIWVSDEGSDSDVWGKKLAVDFNNNIYVTGEFSGLLNHGTASISPQGIFDVYLAKYSSTGNPEWIQAVGSTGNVDKSGDVSTDIFNNIYICLHSDSGTQKAKVLKISQDGIVLDDFSFGNISTYPKGIKADSSGDIYIVGDFSGIANFGDGIISATGGSDYFLVRFNLNGEFSYKSIGGSPNDDGGNSLMLDYENNVIVAGYNNNNIDFGDGFQYGSQGNKDILVVKYERYFSFGEIIISSIDCNPENMCVQVVVTGGESPFTYEWSGGQSGEYVCGLSTGTHTVSVTDSDDCYISINVNINNPIPPSIDMPATMQICPNDPTILDAGDGFASYDWSTGDITQTIEVQTPGLYSVTVSDDNQCTASASTTLSIYDEPDLFENKEEFLCPGDDISFDFPGFSEYLWSNGNTESGIVVSTAGDVWVSVYDGNCFYYDTVTIIVYPPPIVDLGGDVELCPGNIAYFSLTGFNSYLWNDGTTESVFSTTDEGVIYVTVTDNNSCTGIGSAEVIHADSPDVDLGGDQTFCTNEPIEFSAGDVGTNNTYLWSNGTTERTILIYATGNYFVTVTNPEGCTSIDNAFISIFPPVEYSIGGDVEFCEGESFTISATVYGYHSNNDTLYYEWSNGSQDTTLTVFDSGTVSLTLTDSRGCSANQSVNATSHSVPTPNLGSNQVLCEGDSIVLSPGTNFASYQWQDGSQSAYYNVTQAGTYRLTVTNDYGCAKTAFVNIYIEDNPVINDANVYSSYVEILVTGGTAPYYYTHNETETWQEHHNFHDLIIGTYTFTVKDANNCKDSITLKIEGVIEIPSFFTPNGDGYNDYWEIFGLNSFPNAEIVIFDRFGKKLAEFVGDVRWNGKYNGIVLPSDTYWYVIKLTSGSEPITGHVTIKR
jgi:gliding motility-associated-like protein